MNGAVGFRVWAHRSHGPHYDPTIDPKHPLISPYQFAPWYRDMHAECRVPGRSLYMLRDRPAPAACQHPPNADHNCGLYAYRDLAALSNPGLVHVPATIIGAVLLWGRAYVYQHGIRAQHARVLALSTQPRRDQTFTPQVATDAVHVAARLWDVPIIPRDHLEAYAAEHGPPIPPWADPDTPDQLPEAA